MLLEGDGLPAGGRGAAGGITLDIRVSVLGGGGGGTAVCALVERGDPGVLPGGPAGVLAGLLAGDGGELGALLSGELLLAAVALHVVAAEVLEHVVMAREGLGAAVVGTRERLLPGVLAHVAPVVFQPLKGPVAVRAGKLQPV